MGITANDCVIDHLNALTILAKWRDYTCIKPYVLDYLYRLLVLWIGEDEVIAELKERGIDAKEIKRTFADGS